MRVPNIHWCSSCPRLPSGFSRLCSGPAPKLSSEIEKPATRTFVITRTLSHQPSRWSALHQRTPRCTGNHHFNEGAASAAARFPPGIVCARKASRCRSPPRTLHTSRSDRGEQQPRAGPRVGCIGSRYSSSCAGAPSTVLLAHGRLAVGTVKSQDVGSGDCLGLHLAERRKDDALC